jgi:hypothetical protein
MCIMIMLGNVIGIEIGSVSCLLGCIFTWLGSSSYVNNPVYLFYERLIIVYYLIELIMPIIIHEGES